MGDDAVDGMVAGQSAIAESAAETMPPKLVNISAAVSAIVWLA